MRKKHQAIAAFLAAAFVCFANASRAEPTGTPASPSVAKGTLTFRELRERGQRAYRAKRFEEARAYWSEAVRLRPDDAEATLDLAVALSHVDESEQAIKANRDAIRLASSGSMSPDKRRRIRVGAYYNLGKLKSARELSFAEDNDGPSTCIRLESETGCSKPVFACGHDGADGSSMSRTDFRMARFALARGDARITDGHEFLPPLEPCSWPEFGDEVEQTHNRADDSSYDVALSVEASGRKPAPEEGSIEVSSRIRECAIVHVDGCGRRLGLYCEWSDWQEGGKKKKTAKAVELTFTAQ